MIVPEDGPLAVEVKAGIVKIDYYFVYHYDSFEDRN